jgi:hypothetical protein
LCTVRIDGTKYDDDLVIGQSVVRKCEKPASRKFRAQFGHTPLSVEEAIPENAAGWSLAPERPAACPS